jgi:hypothetical protein
MRRITALLTVITILASLAVLWFTTAQTDLSASSEPIPLVVLGFGLMAIGTGLLRRRGTGVPNR